MAKTANEIITDIYIRYYKWAFNSLKMKMFSDEDAQDVIQNTLLSLATNKDLKEEGSISLFLTSVNLTAINFRSRKSMDAPVRDFEVFDYNTPELQMINKNNILQFDLAFAQLSECAKEGLEERLDGKRFPAEEKKKHRNAAYGISVLKKNQKLKENVCFPFVPDLVCYELVDFEKLDSVSSYALYS